MSEKVKVRFGVTLQGHYSREVEMTKEEFEEMRELPDRAFHERLSDWIDWRDTEIDVDWCDEFEEMPSV